MEWQPLSSVEGSLLFFNRMPANTPQMEKSSGDKRRYAVSVDFFRGILSNQVIVVKRPTRYANML